MNHGFYHVQSDKTFLEVLFSSNIEVFFSSNINGFIRAISSLFILFKKRVHTQKKHKNTHKQTKTKKAVLLCAHVRFCDFYVHKKGSIFICIKTSKKKKSFVIFVLFILFVHIKNIWVKTTYVRFVLFVLFVCVKFFREKKK